jgi:UDP-N-acetylmuramoyl-tripeptide--D-alanyl-D-alanine ligase
MKLSIKDLSLAMHGKILSQKQSEFSGIGTDTRKDLKSLVFFAIKGENFDAHDFLDKAVAQGAGCLVIDHLDPKFAELKNQVSIVQVGDSLKAIQDLSSWWRHQHKAKILGLAGSNGKTTTKEFTATLLKEKFKTLYSQGSFNNHIGVPLSLLSLTPEHEMAVIEIGMNHAGEITELVKIADPDAVVVTMVGRAHIEHFGTIEKIAEAKSETYTAARADAVRIFNLDNPFTLKMYDAWKSRSKSLTFSSEKKADVQLRVIEATIKGLKIKGHIDGLEKEIFVPVFGEQNLTNLMAAATLALSQGLDPKLIWSGLEKCKTTWGRNQFIELKSGAHVLFDAYNANPDSMKALFGNMSTMKNYKRRFAVLAEMLELGEIAGVTHQELGELVGRADLEGISFYGPHAADFERGVRSVGFAKNLFISDTYKEELASKLASMLNLGDIVLVKGSRGMKLEQFVERLQPVNFEAKK